MTSFLGIDPATGLIQEVLAAQQASGMAGSGSLVALAVTGLLDPSLYGGAGSRWWRLGNLIIEAGSGQAPSSSSSSTSINITFPEPMSTCLAVLPIPTISSSGAGSIPVPSVTAKSATGCTVQFTGADAIASAITFDYIAIGIVSSPTPLLTTGGIPLMTPSGSQLISD